MAAPATTKQLSDSRIWMVQLIIETCLTLGGKLSRFKSFMKATPVAEPSPAQENSSKCLSSRTKKNRKMETLIQRTRTISKKLIINWSKSTTMNMEPICLSLKKTTKGLMIRNSMWKNFSRELRLNFNGKSRSCRLWENKKLRKRLKAAPLHLSWWQRRRRRCHRSETWTSF